MSFLLPCFAVDHLYLSYDEYLFSEEETPISEGKHTCSMKAALVFFDNTHCTVVMVVYCSNQLTYMYVVCVVMMWSSDPEVGRDVLQLVQCLRLVSDAVSADMAYEMEKALEHLQSPERAAELVLENMLSNDKCVT